MLRGGGSRVGRGNHQVFQETANCDDCRKPSFFQFFPGALVFLHSPGPLRREWVYEEQ